MDPILGEIRMFAGNYAPVGWAFCDGSVLKIQDNEMLFSLLGNAHGGDGYETFALPDMRGRVPVHVGIGSDASPAKVNLGQRLGAENLVILPENLPPHKHELTALTTDATESLPANTDASKTDKMLAKPVAALPAYVKNVKPAKEHDTDPEPTLPAAVAMHPSSITATGNSKPMTITQPYLTVNYIIATEGIYPRSN